MEDTTPTTGKLQRMEGTVESITFSSESGDYVVARFTANGSSEKGTIVGAMPSLRPGEHMRLEGQWTTHKKFGRQFKVERYEVLVPTSIPGLIKYLGSGLIRGIGPKFAERIVKTFGAKALEIIENEPERLRAVPGIGPKKLEKLIIDWKKHAARREAMIFLEGLGLGPGFSARVAEAYGSSTILVVKENPYRMASDVSGIGFRTADAVARNMGFAADSPERAQAGVLFGLHELRDDGHSCYPWEQLVVEVERLLGVDALIIENAISSLEKQNMVVVDQSFDDMPVYLRSLHEDEMSVTQRLLLLAGGCSPLGSIKVDAAIEWVQERQNIDLAESQMRALADVLQSKLTVITGGPGVGKTTIVNCIIPILRAKKLRVALAAPTGRAAKRLSEATGWQASTIHRLLKFNPRDASFGYNESTPLEADAVIVDEASMIDINLMHHLLAAIPPRAMLVLVGDVDQLPPVGPGDTLREIIGSRIVRVARLEEVFRQARRSMIIVNAHRVNHGEMPLTHPDPEMLPDFYMVKENDTDNVPEVIRKLIVERIPERFHANPMDDVQVLTPMHRGVVGAANLNLLMQQWLNPAGVEVQRGQRTFRTNDKVMQISNNYDKEVFNGDIGRIERINRVDQTAMLRFDNRHVEYDFDELGQLVHAYAISVHKSQGSEYPIVIVPVVTQHYVMLQRNLLYTAITRGRKLVVLVGTMKAVARAVRNDAVRARHTHLGDRLIRGRRGDETSPCRTPFGADGTSPRQASSGSDATSPRQTSSGSD